MSGSHLYDCYREKVQPVLSSKLEEFELLGYGTVTEESLWSFLTKKKWKRPSEDIKLFELVEQILKVSVGEYMNFATVEAFRQEDLSLLLNEEERQELLK